MGHFKGIVWVKHKWPSISPHFVKKKEQKSGLQSGTINGSDWGQSVKILSIV